MQIYILLFTIFSIASITLSYLYEKRLTNYTRGLYKLKPKSEIKKAPLFSFLPKRETTKKSIWQKTLIFGIVASIITYVIFVSSYEEPSVYYQAEQIKTLDDIKQMDPFRNTNFIVYTIMFFSFILQLFVLILCYAQLFQNVLFISIHKVFKLMFYLAKTSFIKVKNIINKKSITIS